MKITIESTDQFAEVDGARVRIWQGRTESGIGYIVLVAAVGISQGEPRDDEFEADLVAIDTTERRVKVPGYLGIISLN